MLGDKKDQMSIVVCESLPQVVVQPRMELLWMPRLGYRDNMDLRKRKETPGDYRVIHIRSSVCVCLWRHWPQMTPRQGWKPLLEPCSLSWWSIWESMSCSDGRAGPRGWLWYQPTKDRPRMNRFWQIWKREHQFNYRKKKQVRSRESFLDFRDY